MGEKRVSWTVTALIGAVAVLATLLGVNLFSSDSHLAYAQPETVTANYVAGILGQTANDRTPLFLIDTKAQTIMAYEYVQSRRVLYLRTVRSFEFDRQLQEGYFGEDIYRGPTVRDIQGFLTQQQTAPTQPGQPQPQYR